MNREPDAVQSFWTGLYLGLVLGASLYALGQWALWSLKR